MANILTSKTKMTSFIKKKKKEKIIEAMTEKEDMP